MEIVITKEKLIKALEHWELESTAKQWENREDENRHEDSANYLISLMENMN